jgi:hypothetical protein
MRVSDKEMAPQVQQHPGVRPIGSQLMDTTSVAYVLCRIEDDTSLTTISEYEDIVAAVVAGKHQVEDFDFRYGVYADGARVICFAEGWIGYREWARRNGRLGDIHSIDDRYDHDVDEFMGVIPRTLDQANGVDDVLSAPFVLAATNIRLDQFANGEVQRGVGREDKRSRCWACTSPRKIRRRFHEHKHTSLAYWQVNLRAFGASSLRERTS